MKILQVNCVYEYGSTGAITRDIHRALTDQGVTSVVYYGRGQKTEAPDVRKLCPEAYAKANHLLARLRGIPYGGCWLSTWHLFCRIQKENPDVVHLHCINGHFVNLYALVSWLKKRNIKTILTLHAEFPYTANCSHALDCEKWRTGCGACPRLRQATGSFFLDGTARSFRKLRGAFRGFESHLTVVSVSPWLRQRAAASLILGQMAHRVILNGVDTEIFRHQPQTSPEKCVFHATAMFRDDPAHLKGGYYLLELAKRLEDLPVRFLVAGKYQICGKLPQNVTLLGEVLDRKALAKYYCAASLTLLTSKRETFSMVCVESLCCGTPVVGFEAGGPEGIALEDYSEFVPWGDLDRLEETVRRWLEREPPDKGAISAAAGKQYSRENMVQAYAELYRELSHDRSC